MEYSIFLGLNLESFYFFWVVEICSRTSIPVKEMLVYPPGSKSITTVQAIEKSVKDFDQQTLANINNLKSELTEQMKEKFTIISNDKDKKEGLVEISS